jgi:hypothetical protein
MSVLCSVSYDLGFHFHQGALYVEVLLGLGCLGRSEQGSEYRPGAGDRVSQHAVAANSLMTV